MCIDSLKKEGQGAFAVVCLVKIQLLKKDLVDGSKMGVSWHTVQRVFLNADPLLLRAINQEAWPEKAKFLWIKAF